MLALMILLCRYIFVALAAAFLYNCVVLTLASRGLRDMTAEKKALARQRVIIITMHTIAFTILSFGNRDIFFNARLAVLGAAALIPLIAFGKIFDGPLTGCVLFLADAGMIMIARLGGELFERQLVSACVGLACALAIPFLFKYLKRFKKYGIVLMVLGAALIALPFVSGETRNGAANWMRFGPLSFQPSEMVKIAFILCLTSALNDVKKTKDLAAPAAYGAVLMAVLAIQRDLGGALIFFVIFLCMLYISSGKTLYVACAAAAAALACFVAYMIYPGAFAHVMVRVRAWLDPWADIDAGGYQITQALFAIGTWGVFGSGLSRGYPGRIPVAASDFIFPAVCEEFGILFGLCVIIIAVFFIYFGFDEIKKIKNAPDRLAAAGFVCALAFQGFLSVGGNIKLIPHTGVTLPFMSYGGSSLVASLTMAAFIVKRFETE